MKFIYTIIIYIYTGIIYIFSLFNHKACLWVEGRKRWVPKLRENFKTGEKTIWFHCASLGEFEQGRPVIEMIKDTDPEIKIVLTFFSPSGYEIRKKYEFADHVLYLPADTPGNASDFLSIIKPSLAVFVKYEFWNNYITELNDRDIPLYLISGIFRPGQHFFRWYGGFFRNILKKFTHIFVQDSSSLGLLQEIGIMNTSVAGDTRFDRVSQIAAATIDLPVIEKFRDGERLFLAGSSWKPDEEIIAGLINSDPAKMKWVFAPHEIHRSNIERLEKLFKTEVVRYSEFNENSRNARVLLIDNIGILSSAYRYAYIAAVGGGFGRGIHNIMEPACWGRPVLFGPNYYRFKEADDLISRGGACCFRDRDEFLRVLNNWIMSYINLLQQRQQNISGRIEALLKKLSGLYLKKILTNNFFLV
jgi:3-deoxy-D-manno-octulosonic-acid transferase